MAPKFRYYQKKRGHRRTGSSTLGNVGEALFFAAFLLFGIGGLALCFTLLVVPEWKVNHEFAETTCKILKTQIKKKKKDDDSIVFRAEVKIEYQVNGVTYRSPWTYDIATVRDLGSTYSADRRSAKQLLDKFVVSGRDPKTYACWYNPDDPLEVVLVRGYSWWIWPFLIVSISFTLIGGGGLLYRMLHWGKSAERRAAITQRVKDRDLFGTNGRTQREFPNVPDTANITNSPGITLRFRLPISTSSGWVLFGALLACLLWNGIVSVFVVMAVSGHLEGDPDWVLTVFVVPFALAGIGLIVFFIRQLLLTTGIGPTLVEISHHPLQPGQQCRLFLSQSGRLMINSIRVLLLCEEEATYRQGTDTRTQTWEVHQQEIFRREDFEVHRGMPFEAECDLPVPAGAMHSFKAEHNEITWKVVVEGDMAGWPDYKRVFPVIVRPANGKAQA